MDVRAVSDTHRFGFFVPDEDPPGNQVTTRVEKCLFSLIAGNGLPTCSHPGSIPGEVVSPSILRHAPSCDILVTMRASDMGYAPRFLGIFLAAAQSRFEGESTLPPQAGNASRWAAK